MFADSTLWQRATTGLQILLPSPCIVCGRLVATSANLCLACADELPWITRACAQCGNCSPDLPLVAERCGACRLRPPPFEHCGGLLQYRSPASRLLTGFKFNARFDIGFALAMLLADRMHRYYLQRPRPRLLIPVPLHRNRLRERGYNQSLEIAKWVSMQLRIPVCESTVERTRDTAPQTNLASSRLRAQNLRHAFRLKASSQLGDTGRIAIIDDVVTTMTTVKELSHVLAIGTVAHIDVWCLARAER